MIRIAFVNSRIEARQHIPINLLILAACVEDIAEAKVFDPEYDDMTLYDILDYGPDIVAYSSFTQNYHRTRQIHRIIKANLKDWATYIIGGIHATVLPEQTYEEMKVDCVFQGEGEQAIRDVVLGWDWSKIAGAYYGNKLRRRPSLIQDLDSVPMPAYHLFPDFEKYLIPPGTIRGIWEKRGTVAVISSRGCPYHCVFCGSHAMFGRQVRQRSVGNIIKEIDLLVNNYGARSFWFADDTRADPKVQSS